MDDVSSSLGLELATLWCFRFINTLSSFIYEEIGKPQAYIVYCQCQCEKKNQENVLVSTISAKSKAISAVFIHKINVSSSLFQTESFWETLLPIWRRSILQQHSNRQSNPVDNHWRQRCRLLRLAICSESIARLHGRHSQRRIITQQPQTEADTLSEPKLPLLLGSHPQG